MLYKQRISRERSVLSILKLLFCEEVKQLSWFHLILSHPVSCAIQSILILEIHFAVVTKKSEDSILKISRSMFSCWDASERPEEGIKHGVACSLLSHPELMKARAFRTKSDGEKAFRD